MSTIARVAALTCIAASCAAFVCLSTNARAADATYDYTGQMMSGMGYYTVDNPSPNEPSSGSLSGYPLTLEGTITLAAPLAPNLSNFPVTPIYALFGFGIPDTGGPLILTGPDPSYAGPGVGGNVNANTALQFTSLNFSTDSTGAITGWDLAMAGTPLSFESFTATTTQSGDSAQYLNVEPNFGGVNQYDVGANSTPGAWTEVTPSPAPEIDPGMAGSGLTLLAGMLAIVRGRKRVGNC
jgi:hypothetical protein